jgi:hypothetical protein
MSTPVKIAFATVLVSQTLALILMHQIGHAGLTLATSIGACFNAALLFWFLKKRGIYTPAAGWLRFLAKLAIALFVLSRHASVDRRTCFVLARGIAMDQDRPPRRSVRRGRGRVFRGALAAGFPARRLQSTRRHRRHRRGERRRALARLFRRGRPAVRAARLDASA